MWDERERRESRLTPRFLAWTSGRMELLFTELKQAVRRGGFGGENQGFSFKLSVRYPNGDVKQAL